MGRRLLLTSGLTAKVSLHTMFDMGMFIMKSVHEIMFSMKTVHYCIISMGWFGEF